MPPTTLVTGSTGFVGSTIVNELLSQQHTLILAVRSPSSAKALVANNPSWPTSKITIIPVPDFTAPGAFDGVFKDHPEIDYIVHVAAPMLDHPDNTNFEEHFEKPSVLGNLGLLRSAKEFGRNVKAVSVTGSMNAITTGDQEDVKKRVFSSSEWLPLGREDAIKANNSYISYCVGKKLAEQALWQFVKEEKPFFHIANFMPTLIWGPVLQPVANIKKVNFSNAQIYAVINSKSSDSGKVPSTAFPGWIDVRDLAKLHILALTTPAAANKRFLIGHPGIFNQVAAVLRKNTSLGVEDRVGEDNDEDKTITLPRIDVSEIEDVFGFKWTPLEKTVSDTAAALLELEKKA